MRGPVRGRRRCPHLNRSKTKMISKNTNPMRRHLSVCSPVSVALTSSLLLAACTQGSASDPELGNTSQALENDLPVVFTPKTAAALTGRSAGAAVTITPLLNQPIYAQTLVDHFGDVTPENETKWGSLQSTDPKS